MPETFRPEFGNGEEKPKAPETEITKKGEVVTLTIKEVADHIASKPELQEKFFGKILDEVELKKLEHGISPRIMMEAMESMNLRALTLDELLEVQGASAEEKEAAKEWMKKMSVIPSVGDEFEKRAESAPEAERVRDFSVVDFFEQVKAIIAKESPTPEELEDVKNKFAAIDEIRTAYIEAVWGFKGPEEEEKALSGKLSLGKGGKDEITLIAPSEFFEVKVKLESK